MAAISRAPIARPDYESATLAAAVAGVLGGAGTGWASAKILGTPGMFEILKHAAFAGLTGAPAPVIAVLTASGGIAAIFGVSAFLLVAAAKTDGVVHAEGGQVRKGAGAARKVIKEELARSESLFKIAGLDFSLDRIRRSFLILGSIGGGKTQVIWSLLKALQLAKFRILICDGPKGDYSTATPGNPLIIAPWHDGPAWDIAKDCTTRGHARELARALIPISEKDPIWGNAAGMIFVAILCKLQAEKDTSWGWADLYSHITLDIDTLRGIAQEHYPPAVQILADAESKTTQSVQINLTAFMSDVFEMSLAWRDTPERFSFTDWWQDRGGYVKQQVVILQGSGEFKSLAGGYISSILQLLANLTASPSFPESKTRRNIIVADEFAQLPKMPGFEKFFEIGRSKGCSAIVATQSPAQLRKIWGEDDLQSWVSMIGTKVYARILGHLDAEMVLAELGEREVFRRTETITSNGTGTGGSASVGWQKEKIGVVRQEELAELGPVKNGIAALVQGFGKDPIQLIFPYIDTPFLRVAFTENLNFNKPISAVVQPAPAIPANTTDDAAFTEIATVDAPQPAEAVHTEHDQDEFTDDMPIIQTAETPAPIDVYTDNGDGEHTENMMDDISKDSIENGFADLAGEALDMDSHTIELGLELAELMDGDACKQAVDIEVAAVVDGEKKTGKRGLFKKGNRRKHVDSIDSQEVQQ